MECYRDFVAAHVHHGFRRVDTEKPWSNAEEGSLLAESSTLLDQGWGFLELGIWNQKKSRPQGFSIFQIISMNNNEYIDPSKSSLKSQISQDMDAISHSLPFELLGYSDEARLVSGTRSL